VPPRRTSSEFIPYVLDLARREQVDVVYPVPTAELEMFALACPQFEAQEQRVVISGLKGLMIANNKARLFDHVSKIGSPCTPVYRVIHTWKEFVAAVQDLGYPQNRVCFKPSAGTASIGFRILDPKVDHLDLLLHSPPTSTISNLEEIGRILSSASPFPELIVMEYLPGDEFDVDVLALNGEALAVVPRRNHAMWYGMSLVCTVEPQPDIVVLTKEIVSSLGLSYVISPSFKMDDKGNAKLIEINPRIPGSIITATLAGVNMPYLAVKLALGEKLEIPPLQWGGRMIRYWEEMLISPSGELVELPQRGSLGSGS
jgi:carbamoyl-phosphate synthase large subunit